MDFTTIIDFDIVENRFLDGLRKTLNGTFTDPNTVHFAASNPIFQGNIRAFILQRGLRVMMIQNGILKQPVQFNRLETVEDGNEILILNAYLSDARLHQMTNETEMTLNTYSPQSSFLSTNAVNLVLIPPVGKVFSFVAVTMSSSWVREHLLVSEDEYATKLFNVYNTFGIFAAMNEKMTALAQKMCAMPMKSRIERIELESYVLSFLSLSYRQFATRRYQGVIDRMNPQDVSSLFLARQLLLKDLSNPPEISELAQSIAFSESKLKRLFKQVFGSSVYQYYLNQRMEKAYDLLSDDEHTIAQVSDILGYTNPSQFTKMFKSYHNCLPTEMRRRSLQN
jgi:AraC-like DNA-binding protein